MFDKDREDSGRKKDDPPENKFWRNRPNAGAHLTFETPEDLMESCLSYFDWADDNPLWEQKVFANGTRMNIAKARAMTIKSLCIHIGINQRTWDVYCKRDDFVDVCQEVKDIIYEQKFAGAAAGLFNHAIISRDLGLVERSQVDSELTVNVVDRMDGDG